MKNTLKQFLLVLTFIIPSSVQAAEVACNIEDYKGNATVFFGKVSGDYDLNNFSNGGSMSIKVEIEGNENSYTHNATVRVTKTDTYIEPSRGAHISQLPATTDQYNQHFGMFPNIKCTLIE